VIVLVVRAVKICILHKQKTVCLEEVNYNTAEMVNQDQMNHSPVKNQASTPNSPCMRYYSCLSLIFAGKVHVLVLDRRVTIAAGKSGEIAVGQSNRTNIFLEFLLKRIGLRFSFRRDLHIRPEREKISKHRQ
jgi:hypothetical protein